MDAGFKLPRVDDYEPLIGGDAVARLKEKARALRGMRVVHMSSTYYGGGVAEMLAPLTLLMSSLGIPTEWRLIRGTPEFFGFTKSSTSTFSPPCAASGSPKPPDNPGLTIRGQSPISAA